MSFEKDTVHGLSRQVKSLSNSHDDQSRIRELEIESKKLQAWTCDNCTTASAGAWKEAVQRLREVNAELAQLKAAEAATADVVADEKQELINEIASLPATEPIPVEVVPGDDWRDQVAADELTGLWWMYVANRDDHELRNRLLANYVNFIWYMIHRFLKLQGMSHELADEYFGTGWIGLLKACDHWHPASKWSFLTFASRSIHTQLVRHNGLPSQGALNAWKLNKQRRLLSSKLGRHANDFELANDLGITEEDLAKQLRESAGAKQVSVGEFNGAHEGADLAEPSRQVEAAEFASHALSMITEPHRSIIEERFGEDAGFAEIGEKRGVTPQRAHQLCDDGRQMIVTRVNRLRWTDADGQLMLTHRLINFVLEQLPETLVQANKDELHRAETKSTIAAVPAWALKMKTASSSAKLFTEGSPASCQQ